MRYEDLLKKLSTATIADADVVSAEIEIKTSQKIITASIKPGVRDSENNKVHIKVVEEYSI